MVSPSQRSTSPELCLVRVVHLISDLLPALRGEAPRRTGRGNMFSLALAEGVVRCFLALGCLDLEFLELDRESLWLWTCTLHAARFSLMEKCNKYIFFDSLLTLNGR